MSRPKKNLQLLKLGIGYDQRRQVGVSRLITLFRHHRLRSAVMARRFAEAHAVEDLTFEYFTGLVEPVNPDFFCYRKSRGFDRSNLWVTKASDSRAS
jgi:hypothetical protein